MAYNLEPGLYKCSKREHPVRVTSQEILCSYNQLCQVCISGVWGACEVFPRANLQKRQTTPMDLADMAGTETAALLTGTDGSVERPISPENSVPKNAPPRPEWIETHTPFVTYCQKNSKN